MTMSAIEDAERMAPWIENNADAMQGDDFRGSGTSPISEAVRAALSGPVEAEAAQGTPLLRFVGERPALPLLAALLDPPTVGYNAADTCSRCRHHLQRGMYVYPLWVPAGASVVELVFCGTCHDLLQDYTRCGLHWQDRVGIR